VRYVPGHLLMIVENTEGKPLEIEGRLDAAWYSVVDPKAKSCPFATRGSPRSLSVSPRRMDSRSVRRLFHVASSAGFNPRRPAAWPLSRRTARLFTAGFTRIVVPQGTPRFVITIALTGTGLCRSTFNVVDPSGRTRFQDDLPPGKTGRVEIAPALKRPARRGLLAGRSYELVSIEGIPNFITPSPERAISVKDFPAYVRLLQTATLPAIRRAEKEHIDEVLRRDTTALNDPALNGVTEIHP